MFNCSGLSLSLSQLLLIFPLSWVFNSLSVMCLDQIFFLLVVFWAAWICGIIFFNQIWKCFSIISSNISLLLLHSNYTHVKWLYNIPQGSFLEEKLSLGLWLCHSDLWFPCHNFSKPLKDKWNWTTNRGGGARKEGEVFPVSLPRVCKSRRGVGEHSPLPVRAESTAAEAPVRCLRAAGMGGGWGTRGDPTRSSGLWLLRPGAFILVGNLKPLEFGGVFLPLISTWHYVDFSHSLL